MEIAVLPQRTIIPVAVAEERVPDAANALTERKRLVEPPVVTVEDAALELIERRSVQIVLCIVQCREEATVAPKTSPRAYREIPVQILQRNRLPDAKDRYARCGV